MTVPQSQNNYIANKQPVSSKCCLLSSWKLIPKASGKLNLVAERQVPQHSVPVLLLLQLPERGASFDLVAMREGLFSVSYVNS